MNSLLPTVIIASVLVLAALFALSIGWVLTGKHKIKGGTCGQAPSKRKNESCGTEASCIICKNHEDNERH